VGDWEYKCSERFFSVFSFFFPPSDAQARAQAMVGEWSPVRLSVRGSASDTIPLPPFFPRHHAPRDPCAAYAKRNRPFFLFFFLPGKSHVTHVYTTIANVKVLLDIAGFQVGTGGKYFGQRVYVRSETLH